MASTPIRPTLPHLLIQIGNRPEDDERRIRDARRYASLGKHGTAAFIAGAIRDRDLRRPLLWELRAKEQRT
jgi:hypothetical protein